MQLFSVSAILLYMLGAAGYFTYLFFQRDILQRAGLILLAAGFASQSAEIGWALVSTGHLPAGNLHETLCLVAWAVVGAYLILHVKFKIKILGIYVAPLAIFILLTATQFPRETSQPDNLLKGLWLIVHIVTIFAGDAAFALAAGVGALYLIQEHTIKTKKRGFFFKRLPSLELLDSTGYACIVGGFTLLTIGLITGMISAKIIWGRFWGWDPKEVWSAITWIFYAVLLHERLAVGWRGRRAAIMALGGLAVLLFTFLGVNFLLSGHHGQFTRWQ
jgi:cytochrome c-type biogenesis protein CcsB